MTTHRIARSVFIGLLLAVVVIVAALPVIA